MPASEQGRTATRTRLVVLRLLALAGLAVCAGLLIEGITSGAGLCSHSDDCHEVLHSVWARPLDVPLPVVGLGLFSAFLGLSLVPGRWAARVLRGLALAGGAGGLTLVVIQAGVIHRFCLFCLVVDTAAVLVAGLALAGRAQEHPLCGRQATVLWLMGGLLGTATGAGGMALWLADAPPLELLALRHPDRVTIVEVGDFRCRTCRAMHKMLNLLEAELGDRVYRVCLTEDQAGLRALLCARRQNRERAMADALFAFGIPNRERCRQAAVKVGLAMPDFETCLADPQIEAEMDRERTWRKAASPRGVPAIWIEDRRFDGSQRMDVLRDAILQAEHRRSARP